MMERQWEVSVLQAWLGNTNKGAPGGPVRNCWVKSVQLITKVSRGLEAVFSLYLELD